MITCVPAPLTVRWRSALIIELDGKPFGPICTLLNSAFEPPLISIDPDEVTLVCDASITVVPPRSVAPSTTIEAVPSWLSVMLVASRMPWEPTVTWALPFLARDRVLVVKRPPLMTSSLPGPTPTLQKGTQVSLPPR